LAFDQAALLRVIPGHILFHRQRYKCISNPVQRLAKLRDDSFYDFNLSRPIRLAVEETASSSDLRAWYEGQSAAYPVQVAYPGLAMRALEDAVMNGFDVHKDFKECLKICHARHNDEI
jgi:hypothetical protein